MSELFNTAVEQVCDFEQPEYDQRIGAVKDVAAAAARTGMVAWSARRASEGEFRVAVRPSDYDRLLDRVRDLVMPLCFTVILAALIIGSSIIVALQPGNTTAEVGGGAMLAVATVVAVFWMIALLLSRRRHRG
jgi:hypothetical protein